MRNRWLPSFLIVTTAFMKLEPHAVVMFANANADAIIHDWGSNNEAAACFVSIFNDSQTNYVNDTVALESESVFPGCWNDTFVSISFLSGPKKQQTTDAVVTGPVFEMYPKQTYSFHFNIQVNLDQIRNITGVSLTDVPTKSFARLRLCNALHYGSCDLTRSNSQSFLDAIPSTLEPQPVGQSNYNNGQALPTYMVHEAFSSPWVTLTLQKTEFNNTTFQGTVTLSVTLPSNASSGVFLIEGHAAVILNSPNRTIYVDMTMAMPKTVAVIVESPPVIMTVSKSMVVYVYVISGVFGTFALLCFVFILHHRDHAVLTLAQGSFLAALAASCFIHMVFTFTFLPVNDIFCSIHGILEYIPMSFAGSIMIARVWRAYCTLAIANAIGRKVSPGANEKRWSEGCICFLGWLARLPLRCFKQYRQPTMRRTLRQTATATETASLTIMLTLPQVILQLFGAIFYHRDLEQQMDPSSNIGRIVCQANGAWVQEVGIALAGLAYIGSVAVTWIARDLPSAFNEKKRVFYSAFVNCLFAFATLPLIEFADQPNDPPDITVFLRSLFSVGVGTTNMVLLIFPYIKRVLSGEKVVMTSILGSRFNSTPPSTNTSEETNNNGVVVCEPYSNGAALERIPLKEGEALPSAIEKRVHTLYDVLRFVQNRCCDGRPLTTAEFHQLRDCTRSLEIELCRVDLVRDSDCAEEGDQTT